MTRAPPKTVTALLIDPVRSEAHRIGLDLTDAGCPALTDLYRLLDCELVECAPFDDAHVLWADETGWEQATGFTVIDGGANAIAGRFLIVGEGDDGAPRNVANNVEAMLERLVCHRCLFEAEFVMRRGGSDAAFIVETRLQGVTPRIDRNKPALMAPVP
jgi:hypothetical protein